MQNPKLTPELMAPYGMNCGLCKRYLAYSRGVPKNRGSVLHCSVCIPRNKNCFIKRGCAKLSKNLVRFCYGCEQLPCENVDRLDRRYRKRYSVSLVGNLKEIKMKGVDAFLRRQGIKYACSSCGDVVSIYDGQCYYCLKSKGD